MKSQQLKPDYLFNLFERIAVKLNKTLDDLKPFYHTLCDNWYDNQKALKELSDDQFAKLKIPVRLVNAIKQEIGSKNNQPSNKPFTSPINDVQSLQRGKPSLNEFTMIQYTTQLQQDLKAQYNHDLNQVSEIFNTLYKIIHNIVQDPYELKFRNLKKSNSMVQRVVSANPSVVKFLALFGFQEDNEKYFLDVPKTQELIFVEEVIQQKLQSIKKENFQPFLGNVKMPQKPLRTPQQQMQMGQRPQNTQGMNSIEEQFSKQKLAEMKYVDALDKLLQFRQKMMAQPPKDRKLRIYHQKYEKKSVEDLPEVNMEEEFARSEDQIIKSYWGQIVKENIKNASFQSKRKQEFEYLIKQKIHKETIIKVKLPNEFVIEARFGPLQKLQEVMKLVSSIAIGDIYLFFTPPKKRLDKDMQKTLFELDSVPMGTFYMGTNSEWYIAHEYGKIIQK